MKRILLLILVSPGLINAADNEETRKRILDGLDQMKAQREATLAQRFKEVSERNQRKINNQPPCCKLKKDGQSCQNSDDCRGTCKCRVNNIFGKGCWSKSGNVCQNQANHCDISKCIVK